MFPVYIPEDESNANLALSGVSNMFKKEFKRKDSFEDEVHFRTLIQSLNLSIKRFSYTV